MYEARPNVTVDAAALCLKSANACILRGSRMAAHTNRVLVDVVREALVAAGLPADAVTAVEGGHAELAELIADPATADVVIPRGGEELKKLLLRESRIPVLAAAGGNCHVYVDASADADQAVAIVLNAKVQRPGVCNAAETLLVHRDRPELLARISAELEAAGVELAEGEEAFATEFLDMKMAVGTVDSLDAAIAHINRHGTGPLRGDRHAGRRGGGPLLQRGRRGRGVRERLHPLHRRRRVRHGRRDRQLDEPPARPRPGWPRGADDDEVRRARRRPRA